MHQIIFKSMNKCRRYGPDKLNLSFDLQVTLTFNLPEQMFQMALLLLKESNCAKLFRNPCTNVQVTARSNWDGYTLKAQQAHTLTLN